MTAAPSQPPPAPVYVAMHMYQQEKHCGCNVRRVNHGFMHGAWGFVSHLQVCLLLSVCVCVCVVMACECVSIGFVNCNGTCMYNHIHNATCVRYSTLYTPPCTPPCLYYTFPSHAPPPFYTSLYLYTSTSIHSLPMHPVPVHPVPVHLLGAHSSIHPTRYRA